MNRSRVIMTVIVSLCVMVLFAPMNIANANNADGSATETTIMNNSLAGYMLTTSVDNISQDISAINSSNSMNLDDTPDTSDKTPIHIVSTLALMSLGVMAVLCVKEYFV